MNVIVCLWNAPDSWRERVPRALGKVTELIPQLGAETARQIWPCVDSRPVSTSVIFTIGLPEQLTRGRTYSCAEPNEAVAFDGVVMEADRARLMASAEELRRCWSDIPSQSLEGIFTIVRATAESLEVVTDPLGLYQMYSYREAGAWIVSNNCAVIRDIAGVRGWDSLGVSMYVTLGWAGADRVLTEGVRVLPGGQLLKFAAGKSEPTQRAYFQRAELACLSRAADNRPDVTSLLDSLRRYCRAVSRPSTTLTCPLTGGRDSRLIAGLLMADHLPARYFTAGNPDVSDVSVASTIAEHFGLNYSFLDSSYGVIAPHWHKLATRLVRQTDGLVSVFQAHNLAYVAEAPQELAVQYWGIGGEVCRAFYGVPYHGWNGTNVSEVLEGVVGVNSWGGLVREEAVKSVRDHIERFVKQAREDGFGIADLPDVFYAFDRVRRWAGSGARTWLPVRDVVAPFCTRAFLRASFQFDALHRATEPLHFRLLKLVNPDLHRLPFQTGARSWKSQNAWWNRWSGRTKKAVMHRLPWRVQVLFHKASPYDHMRFLESHLDTIRETCLDVPKEDGLWQFVDRARLEFLLRPNSGEARRRNGDPFFNIATLCYAKRNEIA